MKRYLIYSLFGLSMALLLYSCNEEEPFFYDANQNGVYFDYENAEEFKQNINFSEYVLGNPTEVAVTIKLKVIGYKSDENRKVVLKAKELEKKTNDTKVVLPLAKITIPEVVFEAGEYEKEVEVKIARPAEMDKEFGAVLYIDGTDAQAQIGGGVIGKEEYAILVQESYTKPEAWDAMAPTYLGEWNVAKHIFLVNLLEDNNYEKNLYDYYSLVQYNLKAVNALRSQREQNPNEPIEIAIPFTTDNQYDKPAYWGTNHDKYLGEYTSKLFSIVATSVGANTANEVTLLDVDENKLKDLNKLVALEMMKKYNMYFSSWGLPASQFKEQFYIAMFEDIDYDVIQPEWWSASGPGNGEKPNKYYGEYSEEKYKFMIKNWIKKQGADNFELMQMFPLSWNWATVEWDANLGGEEGMKACAKFFKETYEQAPDGTYNFTFPDL